MAQVTALSGPARQAGVLLVLGGRGAWPDDPPYGSRLRLFKTFFELLDLYHPARGTGVLQQ